MVDGSGSIPTGVQECLVEGEPGHTLNDSIWNP